MITLEETPANVFFAGNPALYKAISSNFLSQTGRKCSFSLVVTAGDTTAGHTISFAFSDQTLTFTSVATPDDSGLQFQKASVSGLWSSWAQTLYNCFQSNMDLASRFKMTLLTPGSSSRTIQFEAFNAGVENSVTVSTNLVIVTEISYLAGIDDVLRDNFVIVGGIWDASFNLLAQDVKPVDEAGEVIFNFSEYMTALLEYNQQPRFTYPFDPSTIVQIFNNYPLAFYAGFAERYAGIVRKIYFDQLKSAMPGGLNRETLVYYNNEGLNFFDQDENKQSFMTWAPLVKTSDKNVPEKLFFYVGPTPDYSLVLLQVKVYFSDGTSSFLDPLEVSVFANNVLECSIGYAALNLGGIFPTYTITAWDVWLEKEDGTHVSEVRTLQNDLMIYENERIFLFQNSFGHAYDVVRFTGKGSIDINLQFATATSELLEKYTSFNAPAQKYDASEGQKLKANSGWVSREMKDYLRELMLSHQVFEYKDGLLYPVVIINESIKEHFIDDEYLYSLDLEYDRAYRDFFFSKLPLSFYYVLIKFYSDDYEDSYS